MTGRMIEFDAGGALVPGYLATPEAAAGSDSLGVVVLHAWWGLTEPFRQVCDRLAKAGFVALAPDLYRGKTTATIDEAQALVDALDWDRSRRDVEGAVRRLCHGADNGPTHLANRRGPVAVVGFSLGGAYAFEASVNLADEIAAVVTFYATYPGLDYRRARAAYLCHFAETDPFEPAESVAALRQELQTSGRIATFYTYPGTKHWFFEANRPDAYDSTAAELAWERTLAFLNAQLRRA